jgi:hypothetical protein
MTNYMNCGFCATRHRIEEMGEHGWGKCGQTGGSTVVFGAQWLLEHWQRTMVDHDGWQDVHEDITEALFPHSYGEVLIREGDFTEADEATMMKSEDRAEKEIFIEFIARFAFVNGITSEQIARAMEKNE